MARFHQLKVKDIRRETADAVSVAFDVPPQLQPEFLFKQGQYLTLKMMSGGEEIRRSYSICAAPHEKEWRVAIKEVADGRASTYINRQLKVGDSMDVMTPMGNFHTPLSGANKKHYVLIAGGSGITPMMSILKSVLYIEKQSKVTLIYANRDEEAVIFKTELEKLEAENADRLRIVRVYVEPKNPMGDLYTGLMTTEKITALLQEHACSTADEYFICGPGPMMENARVVLEAHTTSKEKIHIEYFTAVAEAVAKAENIAVLDGSAVTAKVTVIQYGIETEMELNTAGLSILDAAIEAGVDAPFSCKGAVCCTCRAKVMEGQVKMDANFALTDGEVAEGFILTCQSHPLTERVVVDFDAI